MKDEIDGMLGAADVPPAPEEAPMAGFIGRLARYMLQVAIDAEATAFLGRGRYRRGDRPRAGWRNGYEPKQVQTEAGALELAVPQLRGMYMRGLSTQDVSALYHDTFGASRLSKCIVSRSRSS